MIYIICLHQSQNPRTNNLQSLKGEQQWKWAGKQNNQGLSGKRKTGKMALKPLVRKWLQSVLIFSLINPMDVDYPCQQQQKPPRISLTIIRAFYWSYHLLLGFETIFTVSQQMSLFFTLETFYITEFARNTTVSTEGARLNQNWMFPLEQVSLPFVNGVILTYIRIVTGLWRGNMHLIDFLLCMWELYVLHSVTTIWWRILELNISYLLLGSFLCPLQSTS